MMDISEVPDSSVAIVQYLIRSGQSQALLYENNTNGRDTSDLYGLDRRLKQSEHDTTTLDQSEFSTITKKHSGIGQLKKSFKKTPVVSMVHARERGIPRSTSFTSGDKCRINNVYLPNVKKHLAHLTSKIFCLKFSKYGDTFITASQDRKIRLFESDQHSYKLIKTINAINVGWSILDVAFSPDDQYVAYSSWSECVYVCPLNGDADVQTSLMLCPEERRFCVFSLAFSADGGDVLCGANDGFIYVYDRETNKQALRIEGHEDDVNAVTFADNTSHILYSGGDDGLCKVWDRRTLNETDPIPVGVLAGHMDGVTFIEAKGDGRHFLSNSKDQRIKLWDMRRFSSQNTIEKCKKVIQEQSWDYRWQKIPPPLTSVYGKSLPGDTSLMTYSGHAVLQTLCRCYFSPLETTGQRYIYVGCAAGRVVIYDVLTGKIVKVLTGHRSCVRDVSWHPQKNEILSGSWDGKIYQWEYSENLSVGKRPKICGIQLQEPIGQSLRIGERVPTNDPHYTGYGFSRSHTVSIFHRSSDYYHDEVDDVEDDEHDMRHAIEFHSGDDEDDAIVDLDDIDEGLDFGL